MQVEVHWFTSHVRMPMSEMRKKESMGRWKYDITRRSIPRDEASSVTPAIETGKEEKWCLVTAAKIGGKYRKKHLFGNKLYS